jgi:hypothetical protein
MFEKMKNNKPFANLNFLKTGVIYALFIIFAVNNSFSQKESDFSINNPYANKKQHPYKASLHNHTQFHPEYFHAKVPADQRLTDYRDHDTEPPYGIVAITDHNRITTPDNTIPSGNVPDNQHPWGVDNLLWVVGNEGGIRDSERNVGGHLLIINASDEQSKQPQWNVSKKNNKEEPIIMRSDEIPASVEFSFSGISLELLSCTDNGGGVGKIFIDGEDHGEINFFSRQEKCNQSIFQVNLHESKTHHVIIRYVQKGKSKNKYMGDLIIGSFVVKNEAGEIDTIPVTSESITLKPFYYNHVTVPLRSNRSVEEILQTLNDEGCFLVLAHPNSRLVTEGPDKGKQLWSSSGYVYSELDLIFGNKEKNIPSMPTVPHALEIGNRGYDFSERTAFKNAEDKWDYLLAQGIKVWGTASDDSHGKTPREGWIVVFTQAASRDALKLNDVMQSLIEGNFYASQGPTMEIDLHDKVLTIETEKSATIEFISEKGVVKTIENAQKASYVFTGNEIYVRARVTRSDNKWRNVDGGIGRKRSAWTNPFFVEKVQ